MTAIEVSTTEATQAVDVTQRIVDAATALGDGILLIDSPHTTVALLLTEADDDFLADIGRFVREWPAQFEPYAHHKNDNPNAAAHLVSATAGAQVLVPLQDGHLALGTHQRVILVELDGPKTRRLRLLALPTATAGD
jgi:secondary thiamine-phosphate synthase enzyme